MRYLILVVVGSSSCCHTPKERPAWSDLASLEIKARELLDHGPTERARELAEGLVASERSRLAAAYRLLATVALRQGRPKDADQALLMAMELEPPGITIHPLDPRVMPADRVGPP